MLFLHHAVATLVRVVYYLADSGAVICSILNNWIAYWNQLLLLGDNIIVDRDGLDWVVELGHLGLRSGELLRHRLHH